MTLFTRITTTSSPTTMTSSQQLTGVPDGTAPAQAMSLNRQTVLDEDEYTDALSHIIARDFFPSLVHLDATNNYLNALRTEDPNLINASVRQLQDLATPSTSRYRPQQTPSQTPWAGAPSDTPSRTPYGPDHERPSKKARYDVNMSLDSFQARYTSEDNSSFTQILDEENQRKREKWGWAWEAQKRVEAQRDIMLQARERLLIEPAQASTTGVKGKLVIEAPTVCGLITERGERGGVDLEREALEAENSVENTLILVDDKQENMVTVGEVDVMAKRKDTRPAGVDGWKFKVCCNYIIGGVAC